MSKLVQLPDPTARAAMTTARCDSPKIMSCIFRLLAAERQRFRFPTVSTLTQVLKSDGFNVPLRALRMEFRFPNVKTPRSDCITHPLHNLLKVVEIVPSEQHP